MKMVRTHSVYIVVKPFRTKQIHKRRFFISANLFFLRRDEKPSFVYLCIRIRAKEITALRAIRGHIHLFLLRTARFDARLDWRAVLWTKRSFFVNGTSNGKSWSAPRYLTCCHYFSPGSKPNGIRAEEGFFVAKCEWCSGTSASWDVACFFARTADTETNERFWLHPQLEQDEIGFQIVSPAVDVPGHIIRSAIFMC